MQTVTISSNTSWYLYNFRASTIESLLREGYRVVCLSPQDDYSQKLTDQLQCEWLPLVMDNHGSNPFRDAGLVFQFWRHYRSLKPAVALHFTIKNNVYGTWAARALAIPAINNVSGLGTAFIRSGPVSAIVRLLYRSSQPLAYHVFCQNEEDFAQLADSKLVPRERLELLPGSGVDLVRFNPVVRRARSGNFRFLYAGRMLADKGLNELVAAIREINADSVKCQLWLCGFGDVENVSAISEQQLEKWGQEPGIDWLGPNDAMEEVYADVDCVVLPSYREGMPRSLLEGAAMGLPLVATDVPGCRTIVKDGVNGLLCEAGNSESLRMAMKKMLELPQTRRSRMGETARELVAAQFGEQRVIEATLHAIESAIQGKSSG